MCAHANFYPGNAKQTSTTLKKINFLLLKMSHSLLNSTLDVSYIDPRFFSQGKRGAYLKGALIPNFKPLWVFITQS